MLQHRTLRRKLRNGATIQEIILWSRLRRKHLGIKFRRQHSIGKYIVDFYCPESKIVIELDGWQHKENHERYDSVRSSYLENCGCKILRFWNNEVNENLNGVILKIQELINSESPL